MNWVVNRSQQNALTARSPPLGSTCHLAGAGKRHGGLVGVHGPPIARLACPPWTLALCSRVGNSADFEVMLYLSKAGADLANYMAV